MPVYVRQAIWTINLEMSNVTIFVRSPIKLSIERASKGGERKRGEGYRERKRVFGERHEDRQAIDNFLKIISFGYYKRGFVD